MTKRLLTDKERNKILDRQIERIRLEDQNRIRGVVYAKPAMLSPGEGVYDLDADGYYSNARRDSEEAGSGNLERRSE